MDETFQFCTFYIGDYHFGIDVQVVQEVLLKRQLTLVPLAPPVVCGILNLRGQIVTTIDLRQRLELPVPERKADPVHIVLRASGELVNVLVDSIDEVIEVVAEDFERPPDTLKGVARELIIGAYKRPERLLLVLDPQKTIELDAPPTE
jgi:purine-binding chemotaxis protein CheW